MTSGQIDWNDISYLRRGTERQRAVYCVLQTLGIFAILRDYSPMLVGTIPLDIDVETSDLDVLCEVHDPDLFLHRVASAFGHCDGFRVDKKAIGGVPSVIARFSYAGFPFEVFGQPRPVLDQNAYRHMVVEARLLSIGGEPARRAVRRLKGLGLKTEPAFARYFRLEGDPYETLLQLAPLSDAELQALVTAGPSARC